MVLNLMEKKKKEVAILIVGWTPCVYVYINILHSIITTCLVKSDMLLMKRHPCPSGCHMTHLLVEGKLEVHKIDFLYI